MENNSLEIVDNEILTLFKNEKLSLKRHEITDFVTPIITKIIWSITKNNFSDLRILVNDFFAILTEKKYTYCTELDSSFNTREYHCLEVKVQIINILKNISEQPKESEKRLKKVLQIIEKNKKALNYFASLSIISCEKKNLLISNRTAGWNKRGWNLFGKNFQISNELKAVVCTNFGYGNSSHFYVLFIYKDIPITTFTDYIKYEFVNAYEIIRYSRKFHYYNFKKNEFGEITKIVSLDYLGWENLMSYIMFLSEIPDSGKEEFFLNFINTEFTLMVEKLETVLHSDTFMFHKHSKDENGNISEQNYWVGLKERLLSYKSEKIFGSIDFFTSFTDKFIIENKRSIEKLFEMYDLQFPLLIQERKELEKIVPDFEKKLNLAQESFDIYLYQNIAIKKLLSSTRGVEDYTEEEQVIYGDYLEKVKNLHKIKEGFKNLGDIISRAKGYERDYLHLIKNFF